MFLIQLPSFKIAHPACHDATTVLQLHCHIRLASKIILITNSINVQETQIIDRKLNN